MRSFSVWRESARAAARIQQKAGAIAPALIKTQGVPLRFCIGAEKRLDVSAARPARPLDATGTVPSKLRSVVLQQLGQRLGIRQEDALLERFAVGGGQGADVDIRADDHLAAV